MDSLNSNMRSHSKKIPTKQKILNSATHLFSIKGYTETTIREIAAFIGMTEASIYNHFKSKKAILEYILEEYSVFISADFFKKEKLLELKENPTTDDILSCVMLVLPEDKEEYYFEKLNVILQEQHRNPIVRKFMSEHIFLSTERVFETIINKLKELDILRQDADADFWIKLCSSLMYAFDSRRLLGIGENSPDFSGMGLVDLMVNVCNMMLKMDGTKNNQSSE